MADSGRLNRATVVIVTSPRCGACVQYKTIDKSGSSRRDRVLRAVNGIPDVRLVEISVENLSGAAILEACNKYHPQLAKFVRWFPILMLFNGSFNDRNSELKGVIYGAVKVGDDIQSGIGLSAYEGDKVKEWIQQELEGNSIFERRRAPEASIRSVVPGSVLRGSTNDGSPFVSIGETDYGCFVRFDDGAEVDLREW